MKKLKWSKIFLTSFIWTILFLSIGGYSANKAKSTDPQILIKIEQKLSENYGTNIRINWSSGDKTTSKDEWTFEVPLEKLKVEALTGDYKIIKNSENKIKILAEGQLDKSKAPQLLNVKMEGSYILVSEPAEGATTDLDVTILVPEEKMTTILVSNLSGDILIEDLKGGLFEIESVSGSVRAENLKGKTLNLKTVSGDISSKNTEADDIHVESVSGDVSLRYSQPLKETKFLIESLSGDIHNAQPNTNEGWKTVRVETTSGDIKIE